MPNLTSDGTSWGQIAPHHIYTIPKTAWMVFENAYATHSISRKASHRPRECHTQMNPITYLITSNKNVYFPGYEIKAVIVLPCIHCQSHSLICFHTRVVSSDGGNSLENMHIPGAAFSQIRTPLPLLSNSRCSQLYNGTLFVQNG